MFFNSRTKLLSDGICEGSISSTGPSKTVTLYLPPTRYECKAIMEEVTPMKFVQLRPHTCPAKTVKIET